MISKNGIATSDQSIVLSMIAILFVLDETLLPVFHFFGLSIKVSYIILLFWLVFRVLGLKASVNGKTINAHFRVNSDGEKVISRFCGLIVLSCVGELIMGFFSGVRDRTPFTTAILYYLFMLSAYGLGYTCYRFQSKVLLYTLYAYSLLNIGLLLFYSSLPGVIRDLYGEYYNTGMRIRGSGGNSNTTVLVMNCILLAIVLMHRVNLLKVEGVHVWLVIIVPLLTNAVISSRGELIHTLLLEAFYITNLIKKEKKPLKSLLRILIIMGTIVAIYYFVFHYLYNVNPTIRFGIDRLSRLSEVADIQDEEAKIDSVLRPLFHFDRFSERFKYSPILGAGYSYGTAADFITSANGYHNDWFRVLASTGIVGFLLWFNNIKQFYKYAGICVLLPLCIAGLSNTFVQSVHAFNMYFFTMGVLQHWSEFGIERPKSRIHISAHCHSKFNQRN